MQDARERAEAEVRTLFAENELRRRLKEIRDSGFARLTCALQTRNRQEAEFGTPRDTYGNPIPRPELTDVESIAGACLLLLEPPDKEEGSEAG